MRLFIYCNPHFCEAPEIPTVEAYQIQGQVPITTPRHTNTLQPADRGATPNLRLQKYAQNDRRIEKFIGCNWFCIKTVYSCIIIVWVTQAFQLK